MSKRWKKGKIPGKAKAGTQPVPVAPQQAPPLDAPESRREHSPEKPAIAARVDATSENRVFRRFRAWSVALGSIPSAIFAVAYLACIPTFAGLFCLNAREFFHSTTKHESTLREDEQALADMAMNAWRTHYEKVHKSRVAQDNGWRVALDDIRPRFGRNDHESFTFLLDITLEELPPKDGRLKTNAGELIVHRQPATIPLPLDPRNGQEPTAFYYARIALPEFLREVTKFDTTKLAPLRSPTPGWALMHAPASLWASMEHYRQALEGSPASSSGTYGRMLYLSAVTITTLGYGDIVPTSSTTRTLVSLEAVAGVVLIGLFLNALSQEVSRGMAAAQRKSK